MNSTNQQAQSQVNATENNLKHGQFKVKSETMDETIIETIVNPLNQDELADGWRIVLPRKQTNSTVHHFSVYLSQLPQHLWKYLSTSNNENDEHYLPINDEIYQYSVKKSKYDNEIQKLYNHIMNPCPDKNQIAQLYNHLEKQRVKGWLMVRANTIIRSTN